MILILSSPDHRVWRALRSRNSFTRDDLSALVREYGADASEWTDGLDRIAQMDETGRYRLRPDIRTMRASGASSVWTFWLIIGFLLLSGIVLGVFSYVIDSIL